MSGKHIVGIGGAHVDWIAQMNAPHLPGASTPGQVQTYVGGCCLNSLRVLAQLGPEHVVTMISARGGDAPGERVQAAIEDANLRDQSGIYLDRNSPTYTAILDEKGDVISAVADMSLYEDVLPRHLRRLEVRETLKRADVLVIDANLPASAIDPIVHEFDGLTVGLAISAAKAERLKNSAALFDITFMNRREMGALGDLDQLGFKTTIVTDETNSVAVRDAGHTYTIPVPPIADTIDVTGAGDALAGATLATLLQSNDRSLNEAVVIGVAAARETIQTPGPVANLNRDTLFQKAANDGS
ncbi:MAG: PfkB family carbohydrate kinase [Pseudomonadota bacterium]